MGLRILNFILYIGTHWNEHEDKDIASRPARNDVSMDKLRRGVICAPPVFGGQRQRERSLPSAKS